MLEEQRKTLQPKSLAPSQPQSAGSIPIIAYMVCIDVGNNYYKFQKIAPSVRNSGKISKNLANFAKKLQILL